MIAPSERPEPPAEVRAKLKVLAKEVDTSICALVTGSALNFCQENELEPIEITGPWCCVIVYMHCLVKRGIVQLLKHGGLESDQIAETSDDLTEELLSKVNEALGRDLYAMERTRK